MKRRLIISALLMFSAQQAMAHSRYILPSHTSLSGEKQEYVSFDLSITEDIFHPDIALGGELIAKPQPPVKLKKDKVKSEKKKNSKMLSSLRQTKMRVISPDGHIDDSSQLVNIGRKSVAGIKLMHSGTYRISTVSNPIFFTHFTKKDGKKSRIFGTKKDPSIPAGARQLKTTQFFGRAETYVTRNATNNQALQASGKGIELQINNSTHPNDLFAGEEAVFYFLLNGKPLAKGVKVSVLRDGTRYRNSREQAEHETDENGAVKITWQQAGLYFVEVSQSVVITDNNDIDQARYSLSMTLEVFP